MQLLSRARGTRGMPPPPERESKSAASFPPWNHGALDGHAGIGMGGGGLSRRSRGQGEGDSIGCAGEACRPPLGPSAGTWAFRDACGPGVGRAQAAIERAPTARSYTRQVVRVHTRTEGAGMGPTITRMPSCRPTAMSHALCPFLSRMSPISLSLCTLTTCGLPFTRLLRQHTLVSLDLFTNTYGAKTAGGVQGAFCKIRIPRLIGQVREDFRYAMAGPETVR